MRRKRKVKFINSNDAGNLTLQHITNKKIEWRITAEHVTRQLLRV